MLKLLTSIAIVSALSAPAITAASADPPARANRSARVRTADPRTTTLLAEGLERSATIRALVDQLEQRDVIVYLEIQPALRTHLAGTLIWVTSTPAHRYLRISINPELQTDMAIATIGHELQHALEVANAPQIVCERTLAAFYQQHGDPSRQMINGWDTEAARLVGYNVRREIAGGRGAKPATRVADSIRHFDPNDWFVVYRRAQGMLPP